MRILLDLQAAQSPSTKDRGIGRYSLNFAEALIKECPQHDILIGLNANFQGSARHLRQRFGALVGPGNILLFPGATHEMGKSRAAAERHRTSAINALRPDVVHISTFLEGMSGAAIASIDPIETPAITAVTLYDLIPLIHPTIYLADPVAERLYRARLEALEKADLLLAISESTAREARDHLSIDPMKIVTVGTDADPGFRDFRSTAGQREAVFSRLGISRPFLMYTGGADRRKNLERLVEAYAGLPLTLRDDHQLIIACGVSDDLAASLSNLRDRLNIPTSNLILTGYLSEHDLRVLYSATRLFVFPSLHEGFGLPILEAMRCGAPVIASANSGMAEVVSLEDALFDPTDVASIRQAVLKALSFPAYLERLRSNSLLQSQRFRWDDVARRAIGAFGHALERREVGRGSTHAARKKRLAFVSPMPPEPTGVANYATSILGPLENFYEIDVVVKDAARARIPNRPYSIISADEFVANRDHFERVIYQIGNSPFHEFVLDLLEVVNGVVVLHDTNLSGLVRHHFFRDGETEQAELAWLSALYREYGLAAVRAFQNRDASETAARIAGYPFATGIIGHSLGAIVHSPYARQQAIEDGAASFPEWLTHLPLPCPEPEPASKLESRAECGLLEGETLLCTFGILSPAKGVDVLLRGLSMSGACEDKLRVAFVGEFNNPAFQASILNLVDELGLQEAVTFTGRVTDDRYKHYLRACDIAVQLRMESHGETSLALLECLSQGIPTVVNALGANTDVPADAAYFVPARCSAVDLANAIDTVMTDNALASDLGSRGAAFVASEHAPARYAEALFEATERFFEWSPSANKGVHATPKPPKLAFILPPSLGDAEADEYRALLDALSSVSGAKLRLRVAQIDEQRESLLDAHKSLSRIFTWPKPLDEDTNIPLTSRDILLTQYAPLDAQNEWHQAVATIAERAGARRFLLLDDLRSSLFEDFDDDGERRRTFHTVLEDLFRADGIICTSQSLADELAACFDALVDQPSRPQIHAL